MSRIISQIERMITACESLSTTSTPHEKVKEGKMNLKSNTNKLYHISSKPSPTKRPFHDAHQVENESSYVYI